MYDKNIINVPKFGVKIGKIAFRYSGSQKLIVCPVVEKILFFAVEDFTFFVFPA